MKPKLIRTMLKWWRGHGTRILGVTQGSVAVVASIDGLLPPSTLKYVLAITGLLTYWRGQVNAKTDAPPPAGG